MIQRVIYYLTTSLANDGRIMRSWRSFYFSDGVFRPRLCFVFLMVCSDLDCAFVEVDKIAHC